RLDRRLPERLVPRLDEDVEGEQRGEEAAPDEDVGQRSAGLDTCLEQTELPEEARQGRDAGEVERRDQEQRGQERGGACQAPEPVERGGALPPLDEPCDQEQRGLDRAAVEEVGDQIASGSRRE